MLYNESDQTNIATFTKEGVSRKYYTSFYIHIQPILEIKLMQILFEPSNKSSYEHSDQHFYFRISLENHGLCIRLKMRIFINQPFKCFCIFMWISQKRIFNKIFLSFLQIPSVVHSEFSACSFPLSPVKVTLSLPFSLRFPLFLTRSVPARKGKICGQTVLTKQLLLYRG